MAYAEKGFSPEDFFTEFGVDEYFSMFGAECKDIFFISLFQRETGLSTEAAMYCISDWRRKDYIRGYQSGKGIYRFTQKGRDHAEEVTKKALESCKVATRTALPEIILADPAEAECLQSTGEENTAVAAQEYSGRDKPDTAAVIENSLMWFEEFDVSDGELGLEEIINHRIRGVRI